MRDTTWLDATALAELVRTGAVKPVELVEAAIARIEAVNPRLDAVIRTRFDQARDEAAGDLPDGAFRGVPTLLKDLGATVAGEVSSYGLPALTGAPWPVTSAVAAQLRAAGFVVLGRTTVPELGTTISTEPRGFPATRNPWAPTRSAGGSSGGAAAAVAAGLVPVAHGSDGGGSIRVPASACGLVGLKPTRARVSHGPLAGEAWAGASTDGVLTRTVRDAAGVLDTIAGRMPGEPYYAPPLPGPLAAEVGRDPGRLRIGVLDRPGDPRALDDPECRAAVAGAAAVLAGLGHHLEASSPGALFERDFTRHFVTVVAADTAALLRRFEQHLGRPITDDELEPRNVARRTTGRNLTAMDYLDSRAWIAAWCRRMAVWWDDHDLLLTPVLGAPPPELGWLTAAGPDQEGRRIASLGPWTGPFNMTGQPAISLPLHLTPDGVPVGVQLVARYGREDVLIRIAAQLEQAAPWADRRPAVHA
jgi:amidase